MHGLSSAKSSILGKSNVKKRNPRRCNVCEGRPLQSHCVHTAKGRTYLADKSRSTTNNAISTIPDTNSCNEPIQENSIDPVLMQSSIQQLLQLYSVYQPNGSTAERTSIDQQSEQYQTILKAIDTRIDMEAPQNNPEIVNSTSVTDVSQANITQPSQLPVTGETGSGITISVPSTPVYYTNVQRELLPHQHQSPRSVELVQDQTLHNVVLSNICSGDHEGYDDNAESTKRVRVTAANPVYGLVNGVMRGKQKIQIPRMAPLRPLMENRAAATKRFHRELAALISRCERLCEETDCWLVLAAQHSNASTAATHYTSPRLRKDAKPDTMEIINQFQNVTSALLAARRTEALKLSKRLIVAEEGRKAAEEEVQLSQLNLAEKEKMLVDKDLLIAEKDALIASYKAQLCFES